ncbi:MAG: ribose-phosphate pyrophosphokinase [Candidatus Aquicultor secundus]|uniref:Ribose-phosphate pyrophosphokinase n=1 Tax=Candidatus Aquicultor secundus TaxID=1973895 RepID=A0A2M7T4N5_9ACTN|nr:ribose-phosphate pyrophosphokinase [Candidatus Aquicultor secundus]NCO66599.1 ribose-phosphate pyrophosphokinase [Solirubrobacter sp.]OIO88345.1 MAG: ribose-phosphate pyrophosphokinase [Candidatus Aquicultor secundus]PIW23165.1 MAG: ribose-phosphate pyrophosphokinase [Candidatus Aquicultor secundus]PIX52715.1 MAG: ribose-phosphate pyrophosphokinase [Candidatus Aquicultor secundus]PIY38253.1 MAG: ribose-phosphate pyrophosphokinase [Candidatus Aquicultor secundus]
MASEESKRLMLFSGRSNPALGEEIAEHLGVQLGKVELSTFSNGEIYVRYQESIRGANVFVVQTLADNVNNNLVELLIMVDALKRASAHKVFAVIPHYGYARQDKKAAAREPITAKLIADLLMTAGIDRMVTVDLHAGQIQGFFDVPVDHLMGLPILSGYFKEKNFHDLVVVSPDVGRVKMAKRYADKLGASLAILHKTRPAHNVAEITHIIGEIKGHPCLMIDDMVDTAGTLVSGAQALMDHGATEIYAGATHPVLSGPAIERIEKSPIKQLVTTNTIPISDSKMIPKIKVLSIAGLLSQAIRNVYEDRSVSELFDGQNQL